MSFLTVEAGVILLLIFGFGLILITWFFTKHSKLSVENFLMAGRNIPWFLGSASIAASWIWAPALFISSQVSYEMGLAGIFWFVFPNIIAVLIFIFLAPKIREKFPQGHTLPEYISNKLGDERLHKIYFLGSSFYQLMAVAVQLFAGSSLIFFLTGIPIELSMIVLSLIVLTYSWISGLRSSIITDLVQLAFVFLALIIIIPFVVNSIGGFNFVIEGFSGINGSSNIFDPNIAFSFGIVSSIGLIASAIIDQQFWQRTFAFEKKAVKLGFFFGGVLFGIVPILLSILGFIAANPNSGIILLPNVDPSLIGVLTVAKLLPVPFLLLFFLMLLAGLTSTLDSALNAFSSLYAIDIKKYKLARNISNPRHGMLLILILGLFVAISVAYFKEFSLMHLWWITHSVSIALVVPTILSLYWEKLTAKGTLYGIIVSLVFGLPLFIYSNIIGNNQLLVGSAIFILLINLSFCWFFRKK